MKRLLREGGWIASGQVGAALGTLVGLRFLTEFASPETYGAFVLFVGMTLLVQSLLLFPPSQALLRYFAGIESNRQASILCRAYVNRLIWSVSLTTIGIIAACSVGALLSGWPISLGFLIAVSLVFEMCRIIPINLASAARQQREYAVMLALDGWLRPLGAIGGALLVPESAIALFAGQTVSIGLVSIFGVVRFRSQISLAIQHGRTTGEVVRFERAIAKFGGPLTVGVLVGWVSSLADRYIVAMLLSISEAGMYAAAYGLISRPFQAMSSILEATLRQPLYEAVGRKNEHSERRVVELWQLSALGIGSFGFILVFLYNELIAGVLLAHEYAAGSKLMPWIAGGYVLIALTQINERVCFAHQATTSALAIQAVGAGSILAGAFVGAMYGGLSGVANALAVAFGLQYIASIRIARAVRASVSRGLAIPHTVSTNMKNPP